MIFWCVRPAPGRLERADLLRKLRSSPDDPRRELTGGELVEAILDSPPSVIQRLAEMMKAYRGGEKAK